MSSEYENQDHFENMIVKREIDRSSPDAFAKSLEEALLNAGVPIQHETLEDFTEKQDIPNVVRPKDLHKYVDRKLFPVRMKVIKKNKIVKNDNILDFDNDDSLDIEKATQKFIDIHDVAVGQLSEILSETLAYQQALRHVVERFRSEDAFSDLRHDEYSMGKLLKLKVVTKLCEILKIDKDDALAILFKDEVRK